MLPRLRIVLHIFSFPICDRLKIVKEFVKI